MNKLVLAIAFLGFCTTAQAGKIYPDGVGGQKLFLKCFNSEYQNRPTYVRGNESDWFQINPYCINFVKTELHKDGGPVQTFIPVLNHNDSEVYTFRSPVAPESVNTRLKESAVSGPRLDELLPNFYSQKEHKKMVGKDVWCKLVNKIDVKAEYYLVMACELRDNEYTSTASNL